VDCFSVQTTILLINFRK